MDLFTLYTDWWEVEGLKRSLDVPFRYRAAVPPFRFSAAPVSENPSRQSGPAQVEEAVESPNVSVETAPVVNRARVEVKNAQSAASMNTVEHTDKGVSATRGGDGVTKEATAAKGRGDGEIVADESLSDTKLERPGDGEETDDEGFLRACPSPLCRP
jgi:hypothetical protein